MAFHDLTPKSTVIPANLDALLGLGLKFCPIPRYTPRDNTDTLARFEKDLYVKTFFAGRPMNREEIYIPSMRVENDWQPKEWDLPDEILQRFINFSRTINKLFKKRRRTENNLLPYQKITLQSLANRQDILIVSCDNNLGPAIIDTKSYVELAFKNHLHTEAYKELTEEEATAHMNGVATKIQMWLHKHKKSFGKQELKYLRANFNPDDAKLSVFYQTMKIHKSLTDTRPIISTSGSLLFSIGVWVDHHLQKLATIQPAYIESSRELKDELDTLILPPNCSLFKADAKAMYSNIRTGKALREIAQYLHQREKRFSTIPADALTEALGIVMQNNVFVFGDTHWLQLIGTAMGTPPAPTYANLTYAIHENPIVKMYSRNLVCYKRYIDDIFGIWNHGTDRDLDDKNWLDFKAAIGSYAGLEWTFWDHLPSLDYIDIVISIKGSSIHTTLFEKELNLYLFIPPHSCHPPGLLTGLVLGMCHRIYTLCSDDDDILRLLQQSLYRLRARGYPDSQTLPLFERAHIIALEHRPYKFKVVDEEEALKTRIFFHTEYHISNPKSYELQQAWKENILQPTGDTHVTTVCNRHGHPLECTKMTVAYSRPRNLGNLLSSRNLHLTTGPPVSSYRK